LYAPHKDPYKPFRTLWDEGLVPTMYELGHGSDEIHIHTGVYGETTYKIRVAELITEGYNV
jgi:hypothetical protein